MRLSPINKKKDKRTKVVLTCPKCGYEKNASSKKLNPLVEIEQNKKSKEKITIITKEEAKLRTLPTLKRQCPKCNNKEAYWWMVQTRGADESTTQFFRCTKCGYTEREMA
jgi:DNA-directed RNA polymerase subunit M